MGNLDWPRDGRHIFAGGAWLRLDGAEVIDSVSPTDGTVVGHIAAARAEDVDRVVALAEPAARRWGDLSASDRAECLLQFGRAIAEHSDELAELDTADGGLTRRAAADDMKTAAAAPELFAGYANSLHGVTYSAPAGISAYTLREPYGVAARITPFNHPLMFAVQTAVPVLLAGNAVIVKPPEVASLSTLALAEIARSVFPPGVFNVITGYGHQAGTAIVDHPGIPRIGFTGSVPTGRRILAGAAKHIKHVTLELGGKNPLIVDEGADPAFAASVAYAGMSFKLAGQSCQSTSRILVHSSLYDEVVAALGQRMAATVVGDPRDPATEMGPLAFRGHQQRVLQHTRLACEEGARLVVGGAEPAGHPDGCFLEPTMFTDVTEDMSIAREEVFGPVTAVLRFDDVNDAIRSANDTEFGLIARVVAESTDRATAIGRRLKVGTVLLNTAGRRPKGMPFGGFKESGLGKQSCLEEVLSYTEEKSVVAAVETLS